MIGIDIIEVSRILESVEDPRFVERVFTSGEIAYCEKALVDQVKGSRYAVRFAAKEAVFKALDCLESLVFNEIEVCRNDSGKPFIQFYGKTCEKVEKENVTIHVSLSHSHDFATAMAMVERNS